MKEKRELEIIPMVSEIIQNENVFNLAENSSIVVSCEQIRAKGDLLRSYLRPATGFDLPLSVDGEGDIVLLLQGEAGKNENGFADESYSIEITSQKCILISATEEGLVRAIMTFRQLLPKEIFSEITFESFEWEIRGCSISDSPRFGWRGMHLDVARHFMTKEEVCSFIDKIALYKFNRFHFHLTEDQGWRIEIKKYPLLTEIGSERESTLMGHLEDKPKRYDEKPHSGVYSQEDIREIVAFASVREIIIVPEIDMPGHMQAAISAYPQLGCTDMTLKPLCHWGISQHILNVEESTITFMTDVLDEVIDLFPGDYIHIGGDEAPKYEWEEQRRIQDRMIELGINSEDELQSWFISRMAAHIQGKGRKVIGWDEILEGGLAEGAAVMSWRGEEGGLEAAALDHPVVMTPQSHVYFDHYQGKKEKEPLAIGGFLPLEKVYSYEPIPQQMPEDQHHLVLGSQGQLWTEYMKDYAHVEYMAFPRACALAEILWIDSDARDFQSFERRIETHREIMR